MRNKKNPATSGTPPDKPYIIEIINDSGGKAIFEKLNSLSDPEREAYVKELESRWETEYPKYPATWVQLFAEILPKYVKKRFAGNLDLLEKEMEGATIQHQGQQIAKLVKESELYKFNQKYRNDIDVTDNGIVVMFQQWLKIQKDYLNEMGNTPDPPAPDQRLSHDKIALINYYNGITITEGNAAGIAQKSGWISKTSGRKLWQRYLYFTSNANRNAIPDNPTQTTKRNKIKLFESVLPYLNDTGKQKAEAEIKVLKIKLQTEG